MRNTNNFAADNKLIWLGKRGSKEERPMRSRCSGTRAIVRELVAICGTRKKEAGKHVLIFFLSFLCRDLRKAVKMPELMVVVRTTQICTQVCRRSID